MSIVFLAGNGCSIACNEALTVNRLTRDLKDEFAKHPDEDLRALAEENNSFEALLGPFDTARQALDALPVSSVSPRIRDARSLLEQTYYTGMGIVLQLITDRSHPNWATPPWLTLLLNRLHKGGLTLVTLNYDILLLSSLLSIKEAEGGSVYDLAYKAADFPLEILPGVIGKKLRDKPVKTLPRPGESLFLQLHGSLRWLKKGDDVVQFNIKDIRNSKFFEEAPEKWKGWLPAVVLKDVKSKSAAVREFPFNVAYEIFRERMKTASHLLIAGYGMGDEPVNNVLKECFSKRRVDLPKILIIDRAEPEKCEEKRNTIRKQLNLNEDDYVVSFDGVDDNSRPFFEMWKNWLA